VRSPDPAAGGLTPSLRRRQSR